MNVEHGMGIARREFARLQALYPPLRQWQLGTSRGKTQYGLCFFRKKTITISTVLIGTETDPEYILDTVRHECAHALAALEGDYGHGNVWCAVARRLGAVPRARQRRASNDGPPPRYLLVYDPPNGPRVVAAQFHRRPRRDFSSYHLPNHPGSLGKLKVVSAT
jgi:hypothetical protein